jgi:hypothetical protein
MLRPMAYMGRLNEYIASYGEMTEPRTISDSPVLAVANALAGSLPEARQGLDHSLQDSGALDSSGRGLGP